jgi:hypothetical protein
MNEKLLKYLDGVFSPYEDEKPVKELKEEMLSDFAFSQFPRKWRIFAPYC